MPLNTFMIPYPDFKLYEVIDPEQHDTNNAIIVNKMNELIDRLNSFYDGTVIDGIHSNAVNTPAIEPFSSGTLTKLLEDLIAKIQSKAVGNSGAKFVKTSPITGMLGSDVQGILEELKTLLDGVKAKSDDATTALGAHKSSGDHDTRYYTQAQLQDGVLDNRYFRMQDLVVDGALDGRYHTKASLLGGALDTRYYTKQDLDFGALDFRYDARYVKLGESTGGGSITPEQLEAVRTDGTKALVIEVRTGSDPINPQVGQMWLRTDL